MKKLLLISLLISSACVHPANKTSDSPRSSSRPEWIQKSDQVAEEFTRALAALFPESGSEIGFKEFDKKALNYTADLREKNRALLLAWLAKVATLAQATSDRELQTDFFVLKEAIDLRIASIDAAIAVHEVGFPGGVQTVYENLQMLLFPQMPPERKAAAVDRFKGYVNGADGGKPLLESMQEVFRLRWTANHAHKPLLPYQGEVEQYLKDCRVLKEGVRELLSTSGRDDWKIDWEKFAAQADAFEKFTREEVMPLARKDPRIPKEMYALGLRQRGIETTPEELIKRGLADYRVLMKEFTSQARKVAALHKLRKFDPASVIAFLKAKPVTAPRDVEKLYRASADRLEKIILERDLVSLPREPLRIRIAGEAESKAAPVPHMIPPPLVGNQGERPEFVAPSSSGGLPFDDFSSAHSAMILTAHEGRPGHDLQFSRMLESGISTIRGRYAANSVNIEGWALYAEDLVLPYFSPEEKLFGMQSRLWRIARMFLDPQLQLGQIKDERVRKVFTRELGVSKEMADLELRRYKYESPGQAPSYYHGYLLVKKMRAKEERRLGATFKLKDFNDRLLSFGLLPLSYAAARFENSENPKTSETSQASESSKTSDATRKPEK